MKSSDFAEGKPENLCSEERKSWRPDGEKSSEKPEFGADFTVNAESTSSIASVPVRKRGALESSRLWEVSPGVINREEMSLIKKNYVALNRHLYFSLLKHLSEQQHQDLQKLVMDRKKESKLILTRAAESEKLKQRLRRRKCVFTDENLWESSEELEVQAEGYPAEF